MLKLDLLLAFVLLFSPLLRPVLGTQCAAPPTCVPLHGSCLNGVDNHEITPQYLFTSRSLSFPPLSFHPYLSVSPLPLLQCSQKKVVKMTSTIRIFLFSIYSPPSLSHFPLSVSSLFIPSSPYNV